MTIAAQDLVPLETVKKHLRVDDDSEDVLIDLYAESALSWALWYCDNPKLVKAEDFPASFKAALLLLVGHSYANREAIVTGTIAAELPLAVESLLWSSRDWYGPRDEVQP
ncbi:head-tail connector protein [Pseudomonas sp. MB-090624]|uniref:head-tail connector protein n=1 Tax=Pseudomonas sp. MB-090624 TaxID=2213078 RepID=UPI000D86EC5F|nr:head-tail connector protein [Pseudomonas sp. MB-090624]PYB88885.1 phage gp6-like head-tail connector protein [Pseudomonas sp. MB-090624]